MIPGRKGSERFKRKNFADLMGKPLISYALESSKQANIFDKIILNGDAEDFYSIAKEFQVDFYKRPKDLGSSKIKSDDVVYDFIKKFGGDIIVWVNPICPLMTSTVLKRVVTEFIENNYDSAITGRKMQTHASLKNQPINYNIAGKFSKTQDLDPVFIFSYSVMLWKTSSFIKKYKENGDAFIFGEFGEIEVDFYSSLTVKYPQDLEVIKRLYPMVYLV